MPTPAIIAPPSPRSCEMAAKRVQNAGPGLLQGLLCCKAAGQRILRASREVSVILGWAEQKSSCLNDAQNEVSWRRSPKPSRPGSTGNASPGAPRTPQC